MAATKVGQIANPSHEDASKLRNDPFAFLQRWRMRTKREVLAVTERSKPRATRTES